jgi:hypothetical protein|eukprot:COSAG01_NODE_8140_length_2902_cov_56.215889_4_plen_75_part_00
MLYTAAEHCAAPWRALQQDHRGLVIRNQAYSCRFVRAALLLALRAHSRRRRMATHPPRHRRGARTTGAHCSRGG